MTDVPATDYDISEVGLVWIGNAILRPEDVQALREFHVHEAGTKVETEPIALPPPSLEKDANRKERCQRRNARNEALPEILLAQMDVSAEKLKSAAQALDYAIAESALVKIDALEAALWAAHAARIRNRAVTADADAAEFRESSLANIRSIFQRRKIALEESCRTSVAELTRVLLSVDPLSDSAEGAANANIPSLANSRRLIELQTSLSIRLGAANRKAEYLQEAMELAQLLQKEKEEQAAKQAARNATSARVSSSDASARRALLLAIQQQKHCRLRAALQKSEENAMRAVKTESRCKCLAQKRKATERVREEMETLKLRVAVIRSKVKQALKCMSVGSGAVGVVEIQRYQTPGDIEGLYNSNEDADLSRGRDHSTGKHYHWQMKECKVVHAQEVIVKRPPVPRQRRRITRPKPAKTVECEMENDPLALVVDTKLAVETRMSEAVVLESTPEVNRRSDDEDIVEVAWWRAWLTVIDHSNDSTHAQRESRLRNALHFDSVWAGAGGTLPHPSPYLDND